MLVCALAVASLGAVPTCRADERSIGDAVSVELEPTPEVRAAGGGLFDHSVRRALRAPSAGARRLASRVSDVLLYSAYVAPHVSAVAHALHGEASFPLVVELTLVNLGAQAGAFFTVSLIKDLAGRQRPFAWAVALDEACRDPERAETLDCRRRRNESFISGHAAAAFTGAGLICAHAAYFGTADAAWDLATCATASAAAAVTATLRIVSDQHWATDTLLGAIIGVGWGLAVPTLLHFSSRAPLRVEGAFRTVDVGSMVGSMGAGTGIGIALGALFPLVASLFSDATDDPLEDVRARVAVVPFAGAELGPALGAGVGGAF